MDGVQNILRALSSVLLSEINDTGMVFTVRIMVTDLANGSTIRSSLLAGIHAEFQKNGIRFPQRNLQQDI
jgi:small-conductance mechanosensitive channel